MNKLKILLIYISSNRVWIITLACLDLFFIFLVFDKGFTGDTGSYLSRSTGMGLYLVQKMATDLFITVELKNNSYGGTTVTLTFPKV